MHAVETPVTDNAPAEIVTLINEIVDALGTSLRLPDETTFDNLPERLRHLRDQVDAIVGEESTFLADDDEPTLRSRLEQVTRQLAMERRRASEDREHAFLDAVDQLVRDGRLTPADRPGLLDAARPANYSLSLLAPFERLPRQSAVPLTGQARRHASDKPPASPKREVDEARARQITRDYRRA